MFYVYIIKSVKDNRWYTGQTKDLQHRLFEHNSGKGLVRYTKRKGPWELIYNEEYSTRSEAMLREKYLKTGAGRDFIKRQIQK